MKINTAQYALQAFNAEKMMQEWLEKFLREHPDAEIYHDEIILTPKKDENEHH